MLKRFVPGLVLLFGIVGLTVPGGQTVVGQKSGGGVRSEWVAFEKVWSTGGNLPGYGEVWGLGAQGYVHGNDGITYTLEMWVAGRDTPLWSENVTISVGGTGSKYFNRGPSAGVGCPAPWTPTGSETSGWLVGFVLRNGGVVVWQTENWEWLVDQ